MANLPDVIAVDLEDRNGWLTIWFNQPDNRNALSAALTGDLIKTLEAVRDDLSTMNGVGVPARVRRYAKAVAVHRGWLFRRTRKVMKVVPTIRGRRKVLDALHERAGH